MSIEGNWIVLVIYICTYTSIQSLNIYLYHYWVLIDGNWGNWSLNIGVCRGICTCNGILLPASILYFIVGTHIGRITLEYCSTYLYLNNSVCTVLLLSCLAYYRHPLAIGHIISIVYLEVVIAHVLIPLGYIILDSLIAWAVRLLNILNEFWGIEGVLKL